jgi:hypothetical protein
MASSPTTDPTSGADSPAGSTVEYLLIISALLIGVVVVAGTFAPELLPWADRVVNDIANRIGVDF